MSEMIRPVIVIKQNYCIENMNVFICNCLQHDYGHNYYVSRITYNFIHKAKRTLLSLRIYTLTNLICLRVIRSY